MSGPLVRLASNEDGARIKELFSGNFDGLDWSDIYPHWIVAEKSGRIVGCINVAVSKPIGRLEFLGTDSTLSPHARGRIVRALIVQGLATLMRAGCSASVSQIPFELRTYKRLLKKHFGAVVVGQGNMVMRTL